MNITRQISDSSLDIKPSLTFSFAQNENYNYSSSDDQSIDIQDKQDCLSDNDILLDSAYNNHMSIDAFQTKVETEVVSILIEIYNSSVSEKNVLRNYVHRFAEEINYYSEKLGIQFTVYILQLLAEKLTYLVHQCKLKLNSDNLYKEIKLLKVIKTKSDYQKGLDFLSGLRLINKALMISSTNITYVFKSALDTITSSSISIQEIINELFYKEFIYDDQIIFKLIEQIRLYYNDNKTLSKDNDEQKNLSDIQKSMFNKRIQNQEELNKLNIYLNSYEREYEEDNDNDDDENKENIKEDNNKKEKRVKKKKRMRQKGIQDKDEDSKCSTLTNDQLLEYINNQSPMIKSKKKKRKIKAKKISHNSSSNDDEDYYDMFINSNNIINSENINDYPNHILEDELIEDFKTHINQMSTCAYSTHKIKPLISNEWKSKLNQMFQS